MRRVRLASTIVALGVPVLATSLVLGTANAAPVPPGPTTGQASPASGGLGNHLVALGDSWAAGSAAGDVDRASGACRRSARAYPPRVAAGIGQLRWVSRACAPSVAPGASSAPSPVTTPSKPGTTPSRPGTPTRPAESAPAASGTPATTTRPSPSTTPARPRPSTGDAVDDALGAALGTSLGGALGGQLGGRADDQFGVIDPQTRAVVATVGGDAVGLGALARACSTAGTSAGCEEAAGRSDRTLAALPKLLGDSLTEMRRRAPTAAIVMSGYPRLAEGVACAKGAADLARATRVDAVVDRLDSVLAARAGAAKMRFVDVRAAFHGHGTCAPDPWLTPLNGADPLLAGGPTTVGQTRGYLPVVLAAVRAGLPAAPSSHPAAPVRKPEPARPLFGS